MNQYTDSAPLSQPPVRKSKIRIGIPPAPRAHGEKVIFTHLPLRVKLELKARGWKFYIIHIESIGLGGQS